MHSSRFLHYDRTKWSYHIWDGISMDVAKSSRRGYSCLGIVTSAFMIQDIRSRTNPVALRHRLVVDSSVTGSSTPSLFNLSSLCIPTDRGCMHGIGEGRQDNVDYRRPSRRRGGELYWIGQTIRRMFFHCFTGGIA